MNAKERPLDNVTCAYCHREFSSEIVATKEHVIGRKFVPKNSIKADDWNLILNACRECNHAKSQWESEVSAITLQAEIASAIDPALVEQSQRKAAKVKSSRTRKIVAKSAEQVRLNGSLGSGISISMSLISAPQLDSYVIERLCEAHLRAFFYRITYSAATAKGGCWPSGRIAWHRYARRQDWGNPTQISFAKHTLSWPTRVRGIGADGFFKIALKRHPEDKLVWSFALEWNKSVRIIGFFGDDEIARAISDSLVEPSPADLGEGWKYRQEVALPDKDDELFHCWIDEADSDAGGNSVEAS